MVARVHGNKTIKHSKAQADVLTELSNNNFLQTKISFCYFYSKKTNNDYPKGTVILHQTGRGPFAPSLSPFTVKLETYLRIAKIPYKVLKAIDK